jgi:hypothetical protein
MELNSHPKVQRVILLCFGVGAYPPPKMSLKEKFNSVSTAANTKFEVIEWKFGWLIGFG